MELSLIALAVNWNLLLVILEVAFGLGMVIFVHELGHFAVAKWCGVKCEKFYLGFDIYGLKLAKFQWGETEYGIGILPLGGYVKMLGQDDNPSRAAEERERSTLKSADGSPAAASATHESVALDPRSYMAKSVPQRMAIISAGVIMNVIFAFIMATIAYSMGVTDLACGVSAVMPGEAAWKANLQPGDTILQIGNSGDQQLRFRDLTAAVVLGNLDEGIDFQIQREGIEKPFWVNIKPDPGKDRLRPTIGVAPPRTNELSEEKVAYAETPAAAVAGKLQPGDRIVAVGDQPVANFADLDAALTRRFDQPVQLKLERQAKPEGDQPAAAETVEVELAPRPMRTLGLVMKMGKITAVQAGSPAEHADLRAGDFIVSIDGQSPSDPMRLPQELRRRVGETITLSISREGPTGGDEKLEKQITLRDRPWPEESAAPGSPVSVPALGITYRVLNIVHETEKDSPAAKAQLLEGDKPAAVPSLAAKDEIIKAEFFAPSNKAASEADEDSKLAFMDKLPKPIEFNAENPNWPHFMFVLQLVPADTKVKLTLKDERTATLDITEVQDWYNPDRGLVNSLELTRTQARDVGEAMSLGLRETRDAVLQVYSFLRRLGSQISPMSLGGPVTIAKAAGMAASDGVSQLLIFLTLLSANLAVVNFLPIPLLDGGHMVFLILEGIRGKPVSERVVVAFHYLGFIFIISLMVFVLGLDVSRLSLW